MPTPDDITSLFNDNRVAEREAANQEARRHEEEFAQNHAVETYNDPAPEGVQLVGSDTAWQNLKDHLKRNQHLLNDQREWQANYAEMGPTPEVMKEAEASTHLRPRGGHERGYER